MSKTIAWILAPLALGMLLLVLAANAATTGAADPLTALVERVSELESKLKVLELRINALTKRYSLERKDTLRSSTDSTFPRREEIPTTPKIRIKGKPPDKLPKKKAPSYVVRKEPEGHRGSPIGVGGLYAAGRDILANKDKDTAAIRTERVAAVIGRKTLINAKLLDVSQQGAMYRVAVEIQDKNLVEYNLPHARSPFDTIRINLSVGLDSRVAKLKKGKTVSVQGIIKTFEVWVVDEFGQKTQKELGKGTGIKITMILEDGQVN